LNIFFNLSEIILSFINTDSKSRKSIVKHLLAVSFEDYPLKQFLIIIKKIYL